MGTQNEPSVLSKLVGLRMTSAGLLARSADERLQDGAREGRVAVARLSQAHELLLKIPQRADALSHELDMPIEKLVHLAAGFSGAGGKPKQLPHLRQRDVQRSAVPDEAELGEMVVRVAPVAGRFPSRLGKQPLPLIEAHRLHVTSRALCQFTNFHRYPYDLTLYPLQGFQYSHIYGSLTNMSTSCCSSSSCSTPVVTPRYRRALWVALVLNALMFVVELGASWSSGSVSLMADSIDFFGDAANYGLSLAVLAMAAPVRSKAALFKAACMGAFGLFVLGRAVWSIQTGTPPEPATMGVVAFAALLVNAGVALMLYRFRSGDSNMRSVWLCSRNDAIGNAAVLLAALGVFGTGNAWPDLLVAAVMGGLALTGSWSVLHHARAELRQAAAH